MIMSRGPPYALRALLSGSGGHSRSWFNVYFFFIIWSAPSSDATRNGIKWPNDAPVKLHAAIVIYMGIFSFNFLKVIITVLLK